MLTRTAARSPDRPGACGPPELLHLVELVERPRLAGPLAVIQPAAWPGGDPPELLHLVELVERPRLAGPWP